MGTREPVKQKKVYAKYQNCLFLLHIIIDQHLFRTDILETTSSVFISNYRGRKFPLPLRILIMRVIISKNK